MVYNNPEQAVKSLLERMEANPKINTANKRLVDEHISFLKAQGKNKRTFVKHLYCLKHMLELLGKTSAKDATRKDMERVMGGLEDRGLADETKRNIRAITKQFFKHAFGDDIQYPLSVAWIRTSQNEKKRRLPEDILTDEDVQRLLKAALNFRDRALISILYDTGCRAGELLAMRMKDVEFSDGMAHVRLRGKTGERRVLITDSEPDLRQYLNLLGDREPSGPLWYKIGDSHQGVPYYEAMDYPALAKTLKVIKARAKITKRCNPHSFRHAAATKLAGLVTEQEMKKYLGWDNASAMAAVYVHMNDKALDKKILEVKGYVRPKDVEVKPNVRDCFKCHEHNPLTNRYCLRCGTPLDEKAMVDSQSREDIMKEAITEALKDPKAIEEIAHAYLLMQAKKTKKS